MRMMDSLHAFGGETVFPAEVEDEPAMERPPEIGVDERRMHVRAYNYWVSLLDQRPFPDAADISPDGLGEFKPNSLLIDVSSPDDPRIIFLGDVLAKECGLDGGECPVRRIPRRSLLSRLTDHYLQIIANRAPIGFEAEFTGLRSANTLYRGILMPLSSNGDAVDFIYGVISWKELADGNTTDQLCTEVDRAITANRAQADYPAWADGPSAESGFPGGQEAADPHEEGLTLGLWPDETGLRQSAA